MREIDVNSIIDQVKQACIDACVDLPQDVLQAISSAKNTETSPVCKDVLGQLEQNAQIAKTEQIPICQDTGFTIIFLEIGQDVHLINGNIYDAINEGVRRGYEEGYLRKSIVRHPLDRINTKDNTPAVIHTKIVDGDKITITIAPKGGGSENMSLAKVLPPSAGFEGVKKVVVDAVTDAGSNPCPPIIVGVGLGGTLEIAALLSKQAILREIGSLNPNPLDSQIESDLLKAVNQTGVGASGYGGCITALAVHVESHPCHIASLPVAVTIQCHAARHKTVVIYGSEIDGSFGKLVPETS